MSGGRLTAPSGRTGKTPADKGAWTGIIDGRRPLEKLYSFEAIERIALVREGAPAGLVTILVEEMSITRDKLYRIAGLPRATIDRKLRANVRLDQDETERMIGIARLVGQVARIVRESGKPDGFDAGKWVAEWLDRPVPALGGNRPASFMDTADGRELVSNLVARMQSGAYS